jgi:hypothetical protein
MVTPHPDCSHVAQLNSGAPDRGDERVSWCRAPFRPQRCKDAVGRVPFPSYLNVCWRLDLRDSNLGLQLCGNAATHLPATTFVKKGTFFGTRFWLVWTIRSSHRCELASNAKRLGRCNRREFGDRMPRLLKASFAPLPRPTISTIGGGDLRQLATRTSNRKTVVCCMALLRLTVESLLARSRGNGRYTAITRDEG